MEQSTYSSAVFLVHAARYFKRYGFRIECVQTDNGFEFTNRFGADKKQTLFEKMLAKAGIRHKLIRPYTPRHNGKVERSHREDQKRLYNTHSFYSIDDFNKQLTTHLECSNNRPMRPLNYLSPRQFLMANSYPSVKNV